MSDEPEDPSGTAAELTEPQTAAWPQAEERPAWESIADEALAPAPGPAGPGAAPPGQTPEQAPAEQAPGEVQPATAAGRARRPASLRDQPAPDGDSVPRRTLSAPAFPSAPRVPGSPVTPPVSEPAEPGKPGGMARAPRVHVPNPAALLTKLPAGRLPALSTGRLPADRLRTLTRQRPEVGLGLAFAGGLTIATILKRLGRR